MVFWWLRTFMVTSEFQVVANFSDFGTIWPSIKIAFFILSFLVLFWTMASIDHSGGDQQNLQLQLSQWVAELQETSQWYPNTGIFVSCCEWWIQQSQRMGFWHQWSVRIFRWEWCEAIQCHVSAINFWKWSYSKACCNILHVDSCFWDSVKTCNLVELELAGYLCSCDLSISLFSNFLFLYFLQVYVLFWGQSFRFSGERQLQGVQTIHIRQYCLLQSNISCDFNDRSIWPDDTERFIECHRLTGWYRWLRIWCYFCIEVRNFESLFSDVYCRFLKVIYWYGRYDLT